MPALYTAQGERPDYRFKTTLSHRLRRCQLPCREHIKVYISPERGGGCELYEQTEGLDLTYTPAC